MDLETASAAASVFGEGSRLSALLTTEGLLFAALSISVSLAGSSTFAPKTVVRPVTLAFMAAGLLVAVAVGAALAWTDLFLGGHWPASNNARIEAAALALAIVGQPVIAVLLALGVWRG